jgi:hypothetical protein
MNDIIYSEDKKELIRFTDNPAIETFECPPFVEKIGDEAFAKISQLKELTIPNSVREIGDRAFYDSKIRVIRILNTKIKFGNEAFRWCSETEIWYIPKNSSQSYEGKVAKFVWSNSVLVREENENAEKTSLEKKNFENEIVNLALQSNGHAFIHFRPNLKQDLEILKKAIKSSDGYVFKFAHTSLRSDKKIIDELVELNGEILPYAIGEYMSDREYILKASKTYAGIIKEIKDIDFRDKISKDREIVLNTLQIKVNRGILAPLQYAHESLQSEREIVLEAVKNCGFNFSGADSKFQCDREIVLHAVRTGGYQLQKACFELRDDEEIVQAAISRSGENLKHASDRIKGIRAIALQAVSDYGRAFEVISQELTKDKEIALAAVKKVGRNVLYGNKGEIFLNDPDIIAANIEFETKEKLRERNSLDLATPKELKNNKEFVLNAVSKEGISLQYAALKLRKDKDIIRAAVSNNGYAYKYAILQ